MKKFVLLLFIVVSLSYKKEDASQIKELTYEVITSNKAKWYGNYQDKSGSPTFIYINSAVESGWKMIFKPNAKNYTMNVSAYPVVNPKIAPLVYPNVTINFYVDGKLEKTITSINNPFASLTYNIN